MPTDVPQIQFTNGAAYQRYMGVWSRAAGDVFLDWLAPEPGQRWLDVGCGNGAFTELVVARCAPASVHGIDPSEPQLDHARAQPTLRAATFAVGDAMALPCADSAFDIAVMPLVIFFVPDPAQGVAEMVRAARPGGAVAAYAWDLAGGGFPYEALQAALRAHALPVPLPPSPEASRLDVLLDLWTAAGLEAVEVRSIEIERSYADFDDYWTTVLGAPGMGPTLSALATDETIRLQATVRARLPTDATGRITCRARAHAVKGRVAASSAATGPSER